MMVAKINRFNHIKYMTYYMKKCHIHIFKEKQKETATDRNLTSTYIIIYVFYLHRV